MKNLAAMLAALTLMAGCVVAPRPHHDQPEYRVVPPGGEEHHHHHHDHDRDREDGRGPEGFCPPGQARHGRC